MAETKSEKLEREYVIPLRKEWQKSANYKRTGKAVKAIKKFIMRHMKIYDKDIDKIKLDMYLNQEIWFRGRKKPPAKIKVKAVKEGEIVRVTLAEEPGHVKFLRQKQERRHSPAERPKTSLKTEEKKEEKTDEQKVEEKEKEKAVAEARQAEAKQEAKAQKHLTKVREPGFHRMAMKK